MSELMHKKVTVMMVFIITIISLTCGIIFEIFVLVKKRLKRNKQVDKEASIKKDSKVEQRHLTIEDLLALQDDVRNLKERMMRIDPPLKTNLMTVTHTPIIPVKSLTPPSDDRLDVSTSSLKFLMGESQM